MTGSDITDGPVLSVVSKRLRSLRKKLNRITQMEESLAQGKTLNKEQEEVFRTRPSVTAAIDELEKLRQPLCAAVSEEINLAIESRQVENKTLTVAEEEKTPEENNPIEDLLRLMYFGSMFDVKTQSDFASKMLTRTHERVCCLNYDYVSDDEAIDLLNEGDLDLIATVRNLLTSRPVDTSLSHTNALQKCVERAKLWLSNSDQPIEPDSNVTYSGVREKLAKILASPYVTALPEMKAPVEVVAAAAGNFGPFQTQVEGFDVQHNEEDLANNEGNESYDNHQSSLVEEHHKIEFEARSSTEAAAQTEGVKQDAEGGGKQEAEGEENLKEPQRRYRNHRGSGGRRGYSNGSRGGRNGGGSRGGGRAYQNGRSQYYEQQQPGNHYPRNNYYNNRGGGRGGGRGAGGNSYNNHVSAVPVDS